MLQVERNQGAGRLAVGLYVGKIVIKRRTRVQNSRSRDRRAYEAIPNNVHLLNLNGGLFKTTGQLPIWVGIRVYGVVSMKSLRREDATILTSWFAYMAVHCIFCYGRYNCLWLKSGFTSWNFSLWGQARWTTYVDDEIHSRFSARHADWVKTRVVVVVA